MVEEERTIVVKVFGCREIEKQWRKFRCGNVSVTQSKVEGQGQGQGQVQGGQGNRTAFSVRTRWRVSSARWSLAKRVQRGCVPYHVLSRICRRGRPLCKGRRRSYYRRRQTRTRYKPCCICSNNVSLVVHIAAPVNKVSVTYFQFLTGAEVCITNVARGVDLLGLTSGNGCEEYNPTLNRSVSTLSEDGAYTGEERKQDLFGRHRLRKKEGLLNIVG
jgi:hypothetical protein